MFHKIFYWALLIIMFVHTKSYAQTDSFQILGNQGGIFPKSKTNTQINPIFKKNKFNVNNAVTSKSNQFKSTEKYGGTNTQFAMPKKQFDETTIPKDIRELLKK